MAHSVKYDYTRGRHDETEVKGERIVRLGKEGISMYTSILK